VSTVVQVGFAVFSFDKRGVGESEGSCCPGDHGHFNLATADVVGAVAAIRSKPVIDPARIGLFGASQAGWIAPREAVESGHVAFVVLAAPGIVTFDQEHRYEQLTGGYGSDKPFPSEGEIANALGQGLHDQDLPAGQSRPVRRSTHLAEGSSGHARLAPLARAIEPA
jgi:hypothetical protein